MQAEIPTYDASGKRIRSRSLASIEHLESLSLVVVRRNRHKAIVCAHFRPADGANPLRSTAHMGQKYSILESVGDSGARAWKHRSLLQAQDIEELTGVPLDSPVDLDLYLRGIFRGVALSCLKTEPLCAVAPRRAPANVVSIADRRDGGKAAAATKRRRPIEFASEDKAA